ncbi:unnamed protein product [Pleuronectes platessa]|uniref:THAP-type domain-containing protein n=1 Tax=Pleuronectes platessa TaxID=8262 RepID=A0A9N7VFE0_PLEPL|nr:unnamed protein product [Pleuronectes platessa]
MFIFVVKPLGTCRGWGSSRSVALLSAPPEAQCAAPGGPHPVAPHGVTGVGAFLRGGVHRRRGKRAVGGYRIPDFCAAYGCSNRRCLETRTRGITFHPFPKTRERRRTWEVALRRDGFVASDRTLLCGEHFRSGGH